jgi:hypothetical protein
MELKKLHIFQGHATARQDSRAVSRVGIGIGGNLEHTAEPACGKKDRLGTKHMNVTGGQFHRHHAPATVSIQDDVNDLKLIIEKHVIFDTLLIECLQNHMAGPVGCIAGPADGCLSEVSGVAAKPTLIDLPFRGSAERKPPVLKIVYRLDRFFGQNHGGTLVHQIISAFYCVEGMPFGFVFLHVTQRRTNASLGSAGMAANGIKLGDNRSLHPFARLKGRIQASPTGTHNDCIKFANHLRYPLCLIKAMTP